MADPIKRYRYRGALIEVFDGGFTLAEDPCAPDYGCDPWEFESETLAKAWVDDEIADAKLREGGDFEPYDTPSLQDRGLDWMSER